MADQTKRKRRLLFTYSVDAQKVPPPDAEKPPIVLTDEPEIYSAATSLKVAAIVISCLMVAAVITAACILLFVVEDIFKYRMAARPKATLHTFPTKMTNITETEYISSTEQMSFAFTNETFTSTEVHLYGYNDTGQFAEFGIFRVKRLVTFENAPDACDREKPGSFPMLFFSEYEESYFMTQVNPTWWFYKICLDFYLGYKLAKDKMWMSRDRTRFIDFHKDADLFVTKPKVSHEEACLALHLDELNKINNVPCDLKSIYFMCEFTDEVSGKFQYKMGEHTMEISYRDAGEMCLMNSNGRLAMPLNKESIHQMWQAIPESLISSGEQILIDGFFSLNYETFYNFPMSYESRRTKTKGQISDNCLVLNIKKHWVPVKCDSEHCVVCRMPDAYRRGDVKYK